MKTLAAIPQIDKLLRLPVITSYIARLSRPIVLEIVRSEVQKYRQRLLVTQAHHQQKEEPHESLLAQIELSLRSVLRQRLQPVINATGVMIHTNLGRAPLCPELWQKAGESVCRYSNLELELDSGKRGQRMGLLSQLLQALCGAEESLLVNNNAAALYLMITTLAAGKEVLVSRGEQIQIGGGFRIPDIIQHAGARLRDVGTTNITTIDDYLQAINADTAMVLLVHTSNFYLSGFTHKPDIDELAQALPPHVHLVVDQGSGNQEMWLPGEHTVAHYLQKGADLVCFSSDKMLGSVQGGVIVGSQGLIQRIARHPMMRVVRPGKVSYALLEEQLIRRLNQSDNSQQHLAAIACQSQDWHYQRACQLVASLPVELSIIAAECMIGGGTTPRKSFATYAIVLPDRHSPTEWLERLRQSSPPIIAVASQGQALLFPVSVLDSELAQFGEIVTACLSDQT